MEPAGWVLLESLVPEGGPSSITSDRRAIGPARDGWRLPRRRCEGGGEGADRTRLAWRPDRGGDQCRPRRSRFRRSRSCAPWRQARRTRALRRSGPAIKTQLRTLLRRARPPARHRRRSRRTPGDTARRVPAPTPAGRGCPRPSSARAARRSTRPAPTPTSSPPPSSSSGVGPRSPDRRWGSGVRIVVWCRSSRRCAATIGRASRFGWFRLAVRR